MMQTECPPSPPRRPTQAVIVAGGRGTRLLPLTADRPKPMLEIHGKPFLEYLIEMLRGQGFDRIVLLLGYLPEVIQDYFGDGRRWGIQIEYAVSDVDNQTTRRIKLAEALLDETFLFMYCDNYWPLPFARMWQQYVSIDAPAMITVYHNADGYSRDNVRVDDDGYVTVYDRSRTTPGLAGVEIGYALLAKSLLSQPLDEDLPLEAALYPRLVGQRALQAHVTEHRYYSVGSLQRLPLTERFLARRPAVILDRDGVLNRRAPKAQYVRSWPEFAWLPGAQDALRLFKDAGFRVIVVSNQAGVARGAMTEADLAEIDMRMAAEARRAGGRIDAAYYCRHDWDEGCACRKPRPGMLLQAQREHCLDLSRTVFIGDDERDAAAADAAGCRSALVSEQTPLLSIAQDIVKQHHGR